MNYFGGVLVPFGRTAPGYNRKDYSSSESEEKVRANEDDEIGEPTLDEVAEEPVSAPVQEEAVGVSKP